MEYENIASMNKALSRINGLYQKWCQLQIAAYYGQFCGAKRPRCEAERPGFLLI